MQERRLTLRSVIPAGEMVIFSRSLPSPPSFPIRLGFTDATGYHLNGELRRSLILNRFSDLARPSVVELRDLGPLNFPQPPLQKPALAVVRHQHQRSRVSFRRFFRGLGSFDSAAAGWPAGQEPRLSGDRAALAAWAARYAERLRAEASVDVEREIRMRGANPKFVLRNWIAQEAIERALRRDFDFIEELRRLFATPYDEHPGVERLAEPPSASAREISVSCSS